MIDARDASRSSEFSPVEETCVSSTTSAISLARSSIDAEAIAELKDVVDRLSKRKVRIETAAVAAMELLCCRDKRGVEAALVEGLGCPSLPELVQASVERGAPFRYMLGASEALRDLGGALARGWEGLGGRMQLRSPMSDMSGRDRVNLLKNTLFKPAIDDLSPGQALVLQLPGANMAMVARDGKGALVALTHRMGGTGLEIREGREAQDCLDVAMWQCQDDIWAMVLLDDAALAASRNESLA